MERDKLKDPVFKIHLTPKLYRKDVKMWNGTAIDCYEIGCDCSKCFIYKTYFLPQKWKCYMKRYVKFLLKKVGKP